MSPRNSGLVKIPVYEELGIDPSLRRSGWAVVREDHRLMDFGVIEFNRKRSLGFCLDKIGDHVVNITESRRGKIKHASLERDHVVRNMDTIRKLSYAEAAFLIKLEEKGIAWEQFPPARARKLALGNGRLAKAATIAAVQDLYPTADLDEDTGMAVCLALAGLESRKEQDG